MIKKWGLLGLLMMLMICAKAQYPYVTQYTKNYFLLNAAAAGLDSSSQLMLWNRSSYSSYQSLGFSSLQMGYHTPIQNYQAGLGFKLTHDQSVFFRNATSLSGNYAYNFPFTENTDVRIGIGMGVHRISDSVATGTARGRLINYLPFYDFGMLFNFDNFIIGMSAVSANNPRSNEFQYSNVRVNRVITLMAKYRYKQSELITLMPSLLIRNDGYRSSISLEVKGEAELWNTFLVGLGYRFTRFGQLRINPPFPYTFYRMPDYVSIEVGGYFSELMYFIISFDAPVNTNITSSPSILEGTVGIGI